MSFIAWATHGIPYDLFQAWAYIGSFMSAYLAGKKNIWCPVISISDVVPWTVIALAAHAPGMVVENIILTVLAVRTFILWRMAIEREPIIRVCEHEEQAHVIHEDRHEEHIKAVRPHVVPRTQAEYDEWSGYFRKYDLNELAQRRLRGIATRNWKMVRAIEEVLKEAGLD